MAGIYALVTQPVVTSIAHARIFCEIFAILLILYLSGNFYYLENGMEIFEETNGYGNAYEQNEIKRNFEKNEDSQTGRDRNISFQSADSTETPSTVESTTEHLSIEKRFEQRKKRLENECREKQLSGSGADSK